MDKFTYPVKEQAVSESNEVVKGGWCDSTVSYLSRELADLAARL